jgi:predicted kinase
MAGAGKTTLAKKLELELPAVRLSPDEWIEAVLEVPGERIEMDRIRPSIDALQWQLGQRLLLLGNNVILEQGFWSREDRLNYLQIATGLNAKVFLHYLDISRDELRRRIKQRNEAIPPGSFFVDPVEIDTWLTWFTPPDGQELERYHAFRIYGD